KFEPYYSSGGIFTGMYETMHMPAQRLLKQFSMMARGLYFYAFSDRIPQDYNFAFMRLYPWDYQTYWASLNQTERKGPFSIGNDFISFCFPVPGDEHSMVWY